MEKYFGPWSEFDGEDNEILLRLAWKAAVRLNKTESQRHFLFPMKTGNAKARIGKGIMYEFGVIYGETIQGTRSFLANRHPKDVKLILLKLREDSPLHLYKIRAWIEPPPVERDTIQWMDKIRELEGEERDAIRREYLEKNPDKRI